MYARQQIIYLSSHNSLKKFIDEATELYLDTCESPGIAFETFAVFSELADEANRRAYFLSGVDAGQVHRRKYDG